MQHTTTGLIHLKVQAPLLSLEYKIHHNQPRVVLTYDKVANE